MHDAIVNFCAANNGETRIMAKGSGDGHSDDSDDSDDGPTPERKKEIADKIDEWAANIPRDAQGRPDLSGMAPESIDLGPMLEIHRLALGIRPEEAQIRLSIPGSIDFGVKHWLRNHADTFRGDIVIDLLERTIWNPAVVPIEEIRGRKRRLAFEFRGDDKNVSTILFEFIDDWQEGRLHWEPSDEYMERRQKKMTGAHRN